MNHKYSNSYHSDCYLKIIALTLQNNMFENSFTNKQAKEIGEKLGITWKKFDIDQFRRGMKVELEHGIIDQATNVTNNNSLVTGKIALAHLNEFPDYYERLKKMEKEAELFWKNKLNRKIKQ